jgi:outer membrane protein assembly factor BamB
VSARPTRTVVAVVVAVAATWFVARPAPGTTRPVDVADSADSAEMAGSAGMAGSAEMADSAGMVEWRATMKDGPFDLAADADGVVVTTSAPSVYLLDPGGHVRWRSPLEEIGLGQPALGPDVVLVGGGGSVTALDRSDGSLRWHHSRASGVNSLAVSGDTAVVGDDSGTLAAFDALTGGPRWSVQHPGALWSGARVDRARGAVLATWHQSDSPAVRVFDLATGALRWEAPTDRFTAAPAIHAGRVVLAIGDGDRHARVEARDLGTGALQWQTPVPASFEEAIEPAVDDHAVAVVDHFGVVSLLDPTTGRLRWQRDLADVLVETRVVLTRHRVAFTSYAGVLRVLDRRDGHVVAQLAPGRLGGLPVATVQRGRGILLALRLQDWGVQLRRLE